MAGVPIFLITGEDVLGMGPGRRAWGLTRQLHSYLWLWGSLVTALKRQRDCIPRRALWLREAPEKQRQKGSLAT